MSNQAISIEQITDYMFVPDDIIQADATLVLGMTLWHRPLMKAVELHHENIAGTLIFSGGLNPKLGEVEASKMMQRWIEMGLSPERVLLDHQSVNTRENMLHSKQLLEEHGLFAEDMRLNIIAISYHMRRVVETCRSVFGDQIRVGIVNYPSVHCHRESWFDDLNGKKLILAELEKIFRYLPELNRPDFSNRLFSKALQLDESPIKNGIKTL